MWVAELPGHGSRLFEPPCSDGEALVDALATALRGLGQGPFHLFGHSFGGTLAGQTLRLHPNLPGVRSLIVSASVPPQRIGDLLKRIDEPRLFETVRTHALGGTALPRPLLPFVKRAFQADLSALSSFSGGSDARLKVPIAALAGVSDRLVPLHTIRGWSALADEDVSVFAVPSGHFFFHRRQAVDFFSTLAAWLERFDPLGGDSRSRAGPRSFAAAIEKLNH